MSQSEFRHWQLSTDEKGIAWIALDKANASTNTLSSDVMAELSTVLDRVEDNPPKAAIIYSRKKNGFAAGADVKEFTRLRTEAEAFDLIRRGQRVLERLAALPCPTVAMIHGFALGGGLELALACQYRIAALSSSTQLGFPEVKLGIHPGFGGTVRSVHLMGAMPALQMMLTARTVDAKHALQLGLVDKLAEPDDLRERAINLALKPRRPRRAPRLQRLLSLAILRPLVAMMLRRRVGEHAKREQYPAPYALIALWQKHGGVATEENFVAEAHSIAELMRSETARNLVRVFLLQDRLKSLGKRSRFPLKHVHVIGAGTMGADIAAWCAVRGFEVTLQDQTQALLDKAQARAEAIFERYAKDQAKQQAAHNHFHLDLAGDRLPDADIVIEAIYEDLDAKQKLLREIEPRLGEDSIIATNTSSIPMDRLAKVLDDPSRLIGLHFFNPVPQMPLVEVVSHDHTTPQSKNQALAVVRHIGKLPLPVTSRPGFLVNRILAPYLSAALQAFDRGIALEAIDKAAEDFGMPIGPAELADTVGLDVALSVSHVLSEIIPLAMPKTIEQKVEEGQLGKKTGQGLYNWPDGHALKQKRRARRADAELADILILPLLNESVRCLDEAIVEDQDLLDAGVIFGTGFAPFRGGPIQYIKSRGARELKNKLAELQQQYGPMYEPAKGWEKL